MSLVSVLIPTHDRPGMLEESVASVHEQTHKDTELIIGFDEHGLGPFPIYEKMLPLAHGEYVWFFSDDDKADPRFLSSALALLKDGAPYARTGWENWDGWRVLHPGNGENLNACLFRRSTLDLMRNLYGSVFPSDLRQYGDSALFFRLKRMHMEPARTETPLVLWRTHPGQLTRSLSFRSILDHTHAKNLMEGASLRQLIRQFAWLVRRKAAR